MEIILATNNKNKLKEIREILMEYKIYSLRDFNISIDVIEDGKTFYENALKKAMEIYDIAKIPVIADDSGLCIDQFNDWPGVMTSRFLGDNKTDLERNNAILEKMANLEKKDRTAKVVCDLVFYDGRSPINGIGILKGYIPFERRGSNGFGFDEIFELQTGKTLAELTAEEKNTVSARALAAHDLKKKILSR